MRGVLNLEYIADILLSGFGGSGGQTDDAGLFAKLFFDHFVEHEVGRTEVVRPFGCAMNLINTKHVDFTTILGQIFHKKTLRSNKEHLDILVLHRLDDLLLGHITLL